MEAYGGEGALRSRADNKIIGGWYYKWYDNTKINK